MTMQVEVRDRLAIGCRFRARNCKADRAMFVSRRGVITELSVEGCAIQSPRIDFEHASRILISIGEVDDIEAEVRWALHGEVAVVRFARPLCARRLGRIAHAANSEGHAIKKQPVYLDASDPVMGSA